MIDKYYCFKKDSLSGIVFKIYDVVNDVLFEKRVFIYGEFSENGVYVYSFWLGNYVGEYIVIFFNLSEILEFIYIVYDKCVFVEGVIKVVKFIKDKKNGLYGMDDLLGV